MKRIILLACLLGSSGCSALSKGADWYNAHGPGFSLTLPFVTIAVSPKLQNPPVDGDVGFGPQPSEMSKAEDPATGKEIAGIRPSTK